MLSEEKIKGLCREIESRFDELSNSEANAEEQPPSILYHYTSAEGLLGILQTRELWATNVLYLNDASELSDAREVFRSELDSAQLGLGGITEILSKRIPFYSMDIPIEHFVASFCEDGDLLGQWRAYSSRGTGYSVGFGSGALRAAARRKENNLRGACTLRKVKYNQNQKVEMIGRRIAILRETLAPLAGDLEPKYASFAADLRQLVPIWNQVAASIHPTLALMKHAAFEGEQEWRLVRTLWKPPVPTVPWPVEVRPIGGRLAPYLPVRWVLPNTSKSLEVRGIKEVCCGPSADPGLKEKAARDLLIRLNSWNSRVTLSKVPLRA